LEPSETDAVTVMDGLATQEGRWPEDERRRPVHPAPHYLAEPWGLKLLRAERENDLIAWTGKGGRWPLWAVKTRTRWVYAEPCRCAEP